MTDLEKSARGNLAVFTQITMFKRLSSSGPAFIATLRRHRLRNLVTAYALENRLSVPIGSVDNTLWASEVDKDPEDSGENGDSATLLGSNDDSAANAYNKLHTKNPKAIRWAPFHMFNDNLVEDLKHDAEVITEMLDRFGTWNSECDGKIAALQGLLTERYPDSKVLIFTEAADTARYVYEELLRRGVEAVGMVTGDSENPTLLVQRFSPMSNRLVSSRTDTSRSTSNSPVEDELRVLVSTDVLSEGQNLQDAHIIVNYDLPWAIVKLVQRAGRVDRIGQNSPEVLIYSLMPADPVEDEINLRGRIRERLGENAQLLGSDEMFFGDPTERQIISGVYDEYSPYGLVAGTDDVDPVSMAYEIWRHAEDSYPDLAQRVAALPNIVYSTRHATKHATRHAPDTASDAGVLVHSQTATGIDAFAFVEPNGQARRVTSQEALRIAECEPFTPSVERLDDHHRLTAAALKGPLRTSTGRATGALHGVRGKVWRRLHNRMGTFTDNLLFTKADLEAAHEAINERPLYESAIQRLAKAVRERNVTDLAALVVDIHNNNRLCVPPSPERTGTEPIIVCTMGIRNDNPS